MFPYWSLATAVNCWVWPTWMEAEAGESAIEVNTAAAGLTVKVAEPLLPLAEAVICAVSVALLALTPVARPELLTEAAEVLSEAQAKVMPDIGLLN